MFTIQILKTPLGILGMVDRKSKDYIKKMVPEETPRSPIKAIRSKCIECMGGEYKAISECSSVYCALWPYRFGTNPFRQVSEKQIEQGRQLAQRNRDD